jgi:16S rRNA (cytidine1402-2'-O)-methyltransferase
LVAYHDHNEKKQLPGIIDRLLNKEVIALISDAGTPLISDPGYHLVFSAHEHGIRIVPVPGPSALICALSVAGLPTNSFIFEGFLPVKKSARLEHLKSLSTEQRTLVFYEAPHRIVSIIIDMIDCFGKDRVATLVKELTKVHETIYRDSLLNIKSWLEADQDRQRGEFVLVIKGAEVEDFDQAEATRILNILLQSVSVNSAVSLATDILQGNRNKLYKLALKLNGKD